MILGTLKLLLIGMLFVFLFLLLMAFVIELLGKALREHSLQEEKAMLLQLQKEKKPKKKKELPIVAITAAIRSFERGT